MRTLSTLALILPFLAASCGDDASPCIDSTGCPTGDRCVDGECMPIAGMDGSVDTGGPETGTPDTAVTMDSGGGDVGPTCTAAECDDGNECTDDRCTETGCENANNTAACDDGVFCNGSDSCMGGACDAHTGDPCGGLTCEEASGSCMGACDDDAECPADVIGAWASCGDFSDVCDETGTRTRDVATFTCTGGVCVGGTMTESEACTRDSDGTICDDGVDCTRADRCMDGACEGISLCPPGCTCGARRFECVDERTGAICDKF